jgi:drug/metabolite transporter (DMT)-like permease
MAAFGQKRTLSDDMNMTAVLTWSLAFLCVIFAFWRGRRITPGKPGSQFFTVLGTIFIALLLVNFGIAGCVAQRVCTSGGDTDLVYVFIPILLTPLYWFAVVMGARTR